jgi:putative ABC transport system substrate-binding protein
MHLVTLALMLALLIMPVVAETQQAGKVYRIGFLAGGSPEPTRPFLDEFRAGLRELGYVEGQTVVIEHRWAEGKQDRLSELAADLVRVKVDLIVAAVSPSARAAHQATRTIPIVMIAVGDPIGLGLAASLARPGGNVTGLASSGPELMTKQLQLIKEVAPDLKRLAILWNPSNPLHARGLKDLEGVARPLSIQLQPLRIVSPEDFDGAFRDALTERAAAVWVFGDPMLNSHRARLAGLALNARLPTMHFARANVEAGGLMSYSPNWLYEYRRAATYVDKIIKGTKPAELPIEQPTKFELVINMKTAKALRIAISPSLLLQANEVIE